MNKVVKDATEALGRAGLRDGATVLAGGFGLCGIPENLIAAIEASGVKDLTVVSNNAGVDDFGLGRLLRTRQVRKMVSSYVGENATFERQFLDGDLEVEFVPQGTLAERIRAGGAGLGGFYTPTGFGTIVAEGKETREIDGRMYVLERPIRGDLAIVKAWRADTMGNLVYRMTARNFNPMMATAAAYVIAEVEEVAAPGALDPDHVHTPGVYVDVLFVARDQEKRIEQRTTRPRHEADPAAARGGAA
jgi:3-oxoacid CoA-transferase subunit A